MNVMPYNFKPNDEVLFLDGRIGIIDGWDMMRELWLVVDKDNKFIDVINPLFKKEYSLKFKKIGNCKFENKECQY